MYFEDWIENLFFGKTLEDKLCHFPLREIKKPSFKNHNLTSPGRDKQIEFSLKQVKFPGKGSLQDEKKRALAMHFFANHELLAIEMMAGAIIKFSKFGHFENFIRPLVATIHDEQKHLKLYIKRINELGIKFGEFPLNDFFWKFMKEIDSPERFQAVMALTFEAANLDFSYFYKNTFEHLGDTKSSQIMDIILNDEISHVARGYSLLQKKNRDVWKYYLDLLPPLLTPARSQGIIFNEKARKKAGFSDAFIYSQKNYKDSFRVTRRKKVKL